MGAKLLMAWGLALAWAGGGEALEIYRIGGEGAPRPQGDGIRFHQIALRDFEDIKGLDEAALAQGVLRPLFLNPGENIASTSVERDGGPYVRVSGVASYAVTTASKTLIDGDPSTFYEWISVAVQDKFVTQALLQTHRITLDLGGVFPVSRVRMVAAESGHYPDKLDVAADLGLQVKDTVSGYGAAIVAGELVFRLPENVQDVIDVRFPPTPARSVGLLLYRTTPKAVKIAEIEVFGEGFISEAHYVGPKIDLGEPAIWGDMRWVGRKDPDARVWIQSRAGKDLEPNVYWRFTGRGNEISQLDDKGKALDEAAYKFLKPGEAAGITYDTENWSFWTAPYEFADSSGTTILSPAPNSVFQVRVDFLPATLQGGQVEYIEIAATRPPLVEEVVGEIFPADVPLGEIASFTYALRPTIRAEHSGFDQIEIAAPFGLAGVDSVRVFGRRVETQVAVEAADSTRFSVRLPRHLQAGDSGGVIEIFFRAPVLRYGTAFNGWVRDTQRAVELPQRINEGDAAGELPGDGLVVRTSLSARLLANLQVEPRVFTPNGDGVNESARFSFSLLQLTSAAPFRLEILDLSGRVLRVLHRGLEQSGHLQLSWDGRDGAGELVPPGLYVYRLAVEAEKGQAQQTGTLAVVY